jgi:hypothetical protein
MDTATLALLLSVLSLIVSLVALMRDRARVRASCVPVQSHTKLWDLHVTVLNGGNRPISIAHVSLQPAGLANSLFVNFNSAGSNKIDVGESKTAVISPAGIPPQFAWRSCEELLAYRVFITDALENKHRAPFQHKRKWWHRLRS